MDSKEETYPSTGKSDDDSMVIESMHENIDHVGNMRSSKALYEL